MGPMRVSGSSAKVRHQAAREAEITMDAGIRLLLDQLAALPGSDRLFNPYAESQPGGETRRQNCALYLDDMLKRQPQTVMVFEAPGYRGCRFSGVPVTSERIMLRGIEQWGLFGEGYCPTSDIPGGYAEMTATILWEALQQYADQPPLIWNTVPLHPHQPGKALSNRTPTIGEQRAGAALIDDVIALFRPSRVLAVGRTAQNMLAERGVDALPLRHPSQGGKPDFVRALREAYS
jgi:uracil-DNA glycosylase